MKPTQMAWAAAFAFLSLGSMLSLPSSAAAEEPRSLLLATTTSVQDSGLLDEILPGFTEATGIRVRAVAVGTGAALRMGREGNADVLLTHAPSAEHDLVQSGAVDRRVEIMENYFVLAGPPSDPAGISAVPSVSKSLRMIQEKQAPFVSRSDDSGTHKREVELFERAGIGASADWPGLTRTGSGMGLSLQVAGQKGAYILSDIGTFLAFEDRTGLEIMSRPEASLRNIYSVLRVSPARHPAVHAAEADAFIEYWTRPQVQKRIDQYGRERFGRALFMPVVRTTP